MVAAEFLDARGAGDVYFDQLFADYVEADEPEAVFAQFGADGGDEFAFAWSEFGGVHLAAGMDVGAYVVFARNAQDGAEGFAVEQ